MTIFALNATTGAVVWKRAGIATQEINGSPSVTSDAVYFGANDGNMYAVDRLTGATKFTFTACDSHIFTSAAIGDNGMLYFTCGDDAESPSIAPNKAFALDPALHAA
jgi:outer membrane protein assembly factor BamB